MTAHPRGPRSPWCGVISGGASDGVRGRARDGRAAGDEKGRGDGEAIVALPASRCKRSTLAARQTKPSQRCGARKNGQSEAHRQASSVKVPIKASRNTRVSSCGGGSAENFCKPDSLTAVRPLRASASSAWNPGWLMPAPATGAPTLPHSCRRRRHRCWPAWPSTPQPRSQPGSGRWDAEPASSRPRATQRRPKGGARCHASSARRRSRPPSSAAAS
jgi:hypothetical protein